MHAFGNKIKKKEKKKKIGIAIKRREK